MSKDEVKPRVLVKCASSFLAASLAMTGLAATGITAQAKDRVEGGAVASLRSFPKADAVKRNLLSESVSTEVDNNHSWGGIEQLNVPKTESPAEKAAREQKEQEDAARKQREEQAQAASRSAAREALPQAQPQQGIHLPASASGSEVAKFALQFQGVPYVWGGTTTAGWDCSGFTRYVFQQFGVNLPHQSEAQRAFGTLVSNPEPGDLMWMPGHVGIYIGNGMMVHASTPSTGTIISPTSFATFQYYRIVK